MDDRTQGGGKDKKPEYVQPDPIQDSTLLPMLIVGLALIVLGMLFVMWLA
jgi:hypothetical protein